MPDQRFIVYTRFDGGVSVCAPSLTALRHMTGGGGRWDGHDPGFLDRQIAAQSADGISERHARAFVHAMQFGGCTEAEGYGVMRDRFAAHLGTAHALVDRIGLPGDRWFRDAWRRSHNGGPIGIDMKVARKIQLQRITAHASRRKAELRMDRWRSLIRRAETPEHLKQIWPKGLA